MFDVDTKVKELIMADADELDQQANESEDKKKELQEAADKQREADEAAESAQS